MPDFDVAHINQQGVDLIIIPLEDEFGRKPPSEQRTIIDQLQMCASAAGLKGVVVPVWNSGNGRMGFIAVQNYHPFFQSINLSYVAANINRRLTCK